MRCVRVWGDHLLDFRTLFVRHCGGVGVGFGVGHLLHLFVRLLVQPYVEPSLERSDKTKRRAADGGNQA